MAPGLSRGLESKSSDPDPSQNQGQLQLTDLFVTDDLFNFDSSSSDEDEEEVVADSAPEISIATVSEDDEVIEELTKVLQKLKLCR